LVLARYLYEFLGYINKNNRLKRLFDSLLSCPQQSLKAALSDEMIGFWVIVIMSDIADLA